MTRRIAVSLLLAGAGVWAEDATTPGEATAPFPTITNLSLEWKIAGDDNRNGRVEVEYRRAGETAPELRFCKPLAIRQTPGS